MTLYLQRNGVEEGPFSVAALREMLRTGEVLGTDRAREAYNMTTWASLEQILPPEIAAIRLGRRTDRHAAAQPVERVPLSPATAKQKAFLSYLGVSFSANVSEAEAAQLCAEAQQSAKHASRLSRWESDRARLYPEIFAEDVQARKENRAATYLAKVETVGKECFKGVGKAHVQVLLGYLDVKFPNWEPREDEALWNHLFPALAEKFPALVRKPWRGKLKFRTGPWVAPEVAAVEKDVAPASSSHPHPLQWAAVAALVLGLAAYGYFGWASAQKGKAAVASAPAVAQPAAPSAPEVAPVPAAEPAVVAKSAEPVAEKPATEKPAAPAKSAVATAPVEPKAAPAAPAKVSAPAPARTRVVLTQPIQVQLAYGTVTIQPGTALPILSTDGGWVRVAYLNAIVPVPRQSTDLAAVEH